VKDKVKPAEILHSLKGKRPCHMQVSIIGTISFLRAAKKFKLWLTADKIMVSVLWNSEGVIHVFFLMV
jgi:hypothetical protein